MNFEASDLSSTPQPSQKNTNLKEPSNSNHSLNAPNFHCLETELHPDRSHKLMGDPEVEDGIFDAQNWDLDLLNDPSCP